MPINDEPCLPQETHKGGYSQCRNGRRVLLFKRESVLQMKIEEPPFQTYLNQKPLGRFCGVCETLPETGDLE